MAGKRRGLGGAARRSSWGSGVRGAADRISGAREAPETLRDVSVAAIRPNPWQPREIDEEMLERLKGADLDELLQSEDDTPSDVRGFVELAVSIRENGLLHPPNVRPVEGGFELLEGERRWRSVQILGWTTMPVRVRDGITDRDSRIIALTENLAREDLSAWEEARGVASLRDALAQERGEAPTQRELAELTGRSLSVVNRALQIADGLPEAVWERAGLDVSERNKIEKGALLKASRATNNTEKAALLYRGARKQLPQWAEPHLGRRRGRPQQPYTLTNQLETKGRLTFNLRKRPQDLEPEEAQAVLERLEPVVQALRQRAEDAAE